MDYPLKEENHDYWVSRLKNSPDTICTNDVKLDVMETNQILSKLKNNSSILEIGCGNGLLFKMVRKVVQNFDYFGTDFVMELIDICNKNFKVKNAKFKRLDMTQVNEKTFEKKFDFIISKRAIQNVIDQELQLKTIENLGFHLENNGEMILVESSSTSQSNINFERKKYGLHKISPPFHNLFFDDSVIKNYDFKNVYLEKIIPFASDFYFVTRIIYARLCKEFLKEKPTYDHPLEKIASSLVGLPVTDKYSQIQTYIFKKK